MTFKDDPITRAVYSVDASIYEVMPEAVFLPETVEQLRDAVVKAKSITPRGAATGISGGCLGTGLIVDMSKNFTEIHEVTNEYAICDPGVVQDDLNKKAPQGYRLGPDTSTGNRATLGGMLANNAAGARSLVYGSMKEHILSVDLMLATGEIVTFDENSTLDRLTHLGKKNHNLIQEQFPKLPRRSSGYNLDELIQPKINIPRLIAGSEGTLGIITKMKLKISRDLPPSRLSLLSFDSLQDAFDAVPELLKKKPLALELIDDKILKAVKKPLPWLKRIPKALLILEEEGVTENPEYDQSIWDVRKAGLGLLLSKKSYQRAIAFIEDLTVPPENLGKFMKELLPQLGNNAGIYGHAGAGCLHIRPYIDLRKKEEVQKMHTLFFKTASLVKKYGGAMSGEHGDGLVRSFCNEMMFGKELYQLFLEVKSIFDPANKMNPGKIVNGPPLDENLRLSPKTEIRQIETIQTFKEPLALAADLCNGNGQCRKKEGLMCPSFQVTNNEFHTTRARAQALRAVINSQLPEDALTSKEMYDVMDLCLSCKGCKTECPSHVDMAKMKSEFLNKYHEKHGISLRDRLFAHLPDLYPYIWRLGKPYRLPFLGLAKDKPLPPFAKKRFSTWKPPKLKHPKEKVVLFNDTFTEFHHPEIGIAAVKLLEKLKIEVIIPPWSCCGRPLLSKGFLQKAKQKGEKLKETYAAYKQFPLIGLEPSCLFTLSDDLGIPCMTLEEYLLPHAGKLTVKPKSISLHTHCHQKALLGEKPTLALLDAVGIDVDLIPSGCCGMAGSFGYEEEHAEISKAIGELVLFPHIREKKLPLIANGFSCRCQIIHGTGKRALHLAELL